MRTRCRKEALILARKWWLYVSENKFDWEGKADHDSRMYQRGKSIALDVENQAISDTNPFEFQSYIDDLSEADLRAYAFYDENKNTSTAEPVPKSKTPSSEFSTIERLEQSFRGIKTTGTPLSGVLAEYLKFKKKKVTDGTLADLETAGERLIMFVGDIDSDQLTTNMIQERYIDRRRGLPSTVHQKAIYNTGKKQKIDIVTGNLAFRENGKPVMAPIYKPIDDILHIAANDASTKFVGDRRIYNEFGLISTFLDWSHKRGYVEQGLKDILVESADKPGGSSLTNFTNNDLKLIFESASYQQGLLFNTPHFHWLPIISLYHGNRIGEITMLYLNNLYQVEFDDDNGTKHLIWVFDIEDNSERRQRVKNKRSIRIIPIHQTLIDLGLIEYRDQLASKGEQRLFPAENPNGKGNWGGKTSIWFNNSYDNNKKSKGFAEYCGIQKHVKNKNEDKKKVFHSLRGNWVTRANRLKMDKDMCRELTGHAQGEQLDIHTLSYDEGHELLARHTEINKLNYNIEISLIKKWG